MGFTVRRAKKGDEAGGEDIGRMLVDKLYTFLAGIAFKYRDNNTWTFISELKMAIHSFS